MGFPGSIVVKHSPANAGDARGEGWILGLGRFTAIENNNPS